MKVKIIFGVLFILLINFAVYEQLRVIISQERGRLQNHVSEQSDELMRQNKELLNQLKDLRGETYAIQQQLYNQARFNDHPRVKDPQFSDPSRIFQSSFLLKTTPPSKKNIVRYTTDGSRVTQTSQLFSGELWIDQSLIIRAKAYRKGRLPSREVVRTFLLDQGENSVLSIIVDPEDLYSPSRGIISNPYERGKLWEKQARLQYFEEKELGFDVSSGIRIHGKGSRDWEHKNFRFYFRKKYGNKNLEYNLFRSGLTKFKRLLIKDNPLKTLVGFKLIQQMGGKTPRAIPVSTYLNGKAYSNYFLSERIDQHFGKSHFGKKPLAIIKLRESIKQWNYGLQYGDVSFYENFHNWVYHPDSEISFETVKKRIDINDLTAMLLAHLFASEADGNQWIMFFFNGLEGPKARLVAWDMDGMFRRKKVREDEKNEGHAWQTNMYQYTFQGETSFQLNKQSLKALKDEGVPNSLLTALKSMKSPQEFSGKIQFLEKVERTIGKNQTLQYQSLIMKHVQRGIDDLSEKWLVFKLAKELLKDPNYRQYFLQKTDFFLNHRLKPDRIEALLQEFRQKKTPGDYETIKQFIINRPEYFRKQTMQFLGVDESHRLKLEILGGVVCGSMVLWKTSYFLELIFKAPL